MTWETQAPKEQPKPAEQPKAETPVEAKPEEKPAETPAPEVAKPAEGKPEEPAAATPPQPGAEAQPKEAPQAVVPQDVVGRALKAQREKFKEKQQQANSRVVDLEMENERLRKQLADQPDSQTPDPESQSEELVAKKVKEDFLKRQDIYGRHKYGDQNYRDALELIAMQNDPSLVAKIQSDYSPADALMTEAKRIAEELELGATPQERERKKAQILEADIRKKVEAEYAEKLKIRGNQPTDVQNVRAAGGDHRPNPQRDTWTTGKTALKS